MRLPVGMGWITIRAKSTSNVFGNDVRKFPDGTLRPHQGWDIAAFTGSKVYAIYDGIIESTGNQIKYGNYVCLRFQLRGENLYAFYAHLQSIKCAPGDVVTEGAVLGLSGQTGNAAGQHHSEAHLHFEIRTHPGGGQRDPGSVLGYAPMVETLFDYKI